MGARTLAAMLVVGAVAANVTATTVVCTDRGLFEPLLQPGYYLEEFNTNHWEEPHVGTPAASYAGNGYAYLLTSSTVGGLAHGLWSLEGAESVINSMDLLVARFTGRPVYAVGGNFYGTDLFGGYVPSQVILNFGDGTVYVYENTDIHSFLGFVSTTPIVTLSVDSIRTAGGAAPTLDNFYVGAPIPEPLTLIGAGLSVGALGAYLRRRQVLAQNLV